MDLKPQIKKVITDTCTHWICADDEELNKCTTELEEQFNAIVNTEIERRQSDTSEKSNLALFGVMPRYSVVHCQFFGVTDGLIENNLTEKEADELIEKLNKESDCYEWYEKKPNEA